MSTRSYMSEHLLSFLQKEVDTLFPGLQGGYTSDLFPNIIKRHAGVTRDPRSFIPPETESRGSCNNHSDNDESKYYQE